jgi:hypothetical protein
LRGHVELPLTRAAQKWFACAKAAGQLSADWRTLNGPPLVVGVWEKILTHSIPVNQDEFKERRLK